jgi:hypothetical protein
MKQSHRIVAIAGMGLVFVAGVFAQAPPGPITPPADAVNSGPPTPPPPKIEPRKNILGSWVLNRDDSDDPRQRSNQRKVNDPNSSHGGYGGPRIGFPGGGIGGPGIGGGQRPNGSQKDTEQEKERYRELIDPSVRLRMEGKSGTDPVVTMFGDQGRKTIFYTDGHKPDEPAGVGTDLVEAHWEGTKLVSESQLPKKGSMRRTYEVSPDGMQLFEEVELVVGKDKNPSKFRFVYDAVNGDNY